jgi:hypothetical protein
MKGFQLAAFAEGDFSDWVRKFECVSKVKKWNEKEKADYLPLFLQGDAFEVHFNLQDEKKESYNEAAKELQQSFCRKRSQVLVEFGELEMKQGKSARMYLLELRKSCKACYPDFGDKEREKLVLDRFMSGIPKKVVPHIVSNKTLTDTDMIADTVDQLLAVSGEESCHVAMQECDRENIKALQEEISRLHARVEQVASVARAGDSRGKSSLNERQDPPKDNAYVNRGRTDIKWRHTQNIQCYRCQQMGHIARFCTFVAGNDNRASERSYRRL